MRPRLSSLLLQDQILFCLYKYVLSWPTCSLCNFDHAQGQHNWILRTKYFFLISSHVDLARGQNWICKSYILFLGTLLMEPMSSVTSVNSSTEVLYYFNQNMKIGQHSDAIFLWNNFFSKVKAV